MGYEYNLKIELPQVTQRPSIKITSPLAGVQTSRIIAVDGRASYPPESADPLARRSGTPWEGITNWGAPGSAQSVGESPENDTRPVLYLHGNTEEGCTGNGEADLIACDGPFLCGRPSSPRARPPSRWTCVDDEPLEGSSDRTIYDTSWVWCLAPGEGCPATPEAGIPAGPQTVGGPMTVEWWAQCNLCGGIFSADWNIRVWADGVLKFEQRVGASPPALGEPGRVSTTVALPTFTANQRITVHIDPDFVDAQTVTFIYYDSESPCNALAPAGTRCDSLVRMPVGGGAGEAAPTPPQNIRVTDLAGTKSLRVALDPQSPAPERYGSTGSTDPVFPNGGTKIKGTFAACTSPQVPTPGSAGRPRPDRPLLHGWQRQVRQRLLLPRRVGAHERAGPGRPQLRLGDRLRHADQVRPAGEGEGSQYLLRSGQTAARARREQPDAAGHRKQRHDLELRVGHAGARQRDLRGFPGTAVHARARPARPLGAFVHAGSRLDEGREVGPAGRYGLTAVVPRAGTTPALGT